MTEPSKYKNMTNETRQALGIEFLGKDTRISLQYHLMEYFKKNSYDNVDKFFEITNLLRRRKDIPNLDYDGEFIHEDLIYMGSMVQSAFSGLDSVEALSLLCDLRTFKAIDIDTVNQILEEDGFPFKIIDRDPRPYVGVVEQMNLDDFANASEVEPAIRHLLSRMEDTFRRGDFPGVLAAGSNVIEAIARRQSNHPRAASSTFKNVKRLFLQNSSLPDVLKTEFNRIYIARNTTPNAAHGNLEIDNDVTAVEAATIISICYTSVKHYWLFRDNLHD